MQLSAVPRNVVALAGPKAICSKSSEIAFEVHQKLPMTTLNFLVFSIEKRVPLDQTRTGIQM